MFRGCCKKCNLLRLLEVVVDAGILTVQFVGEVLQVLCDKAPSLVALHVVVVKVPIEKGLSVLLQIAEKLLLNLLQ